MSEIKNITSEKTKEYRKQYYKKYFEEKKEELQIKITCDECGYEYSKCNKSNHEKTKRHQNAVLINKLENDLKNVKKILMKK